MKYYRNGAFLDKIATIAKVKLDIVNCIYCQVIIAIQKSNLYIKYVK